MNTKSYCMAKQALRLTELSDSISEGMLVPSVHRLLLRAHTVDLRSWPHNHVCLTAKTACPCFIYVAKVG